MSSLRKQLMIWLLPMYALAAFVACGITYHMYGSMVSFFMDNQLRVFADSHAVASGPTPAFRPLTAHSVVDKGDMIVQIWDRTHRLVTTSWPELALQRQSTQGFHDITIGDSRWRVYTLQSPDRTVQSAQNLEFRKHQSDATKTVSDNVVGQKLECNENSAPFIATANSAGENACM